MDIRFLLFFSSQTAKGSSRLKILDTLRNVWRTEGFYGLFAGNGTNLLRIFPTSAIVCLVYSRMIKVSIQVIAVLLHYH